MSENAEKHCCMHSWSYWSDKTLESNMSDVCLSEIEKMLSWVVNVFIANKALEEGTCDKRQ
jgi:hypothetical protein